MCVIIYTLHPPCDQIKEVEMSKICRSDGKFKNAYKCWSENLTLWDIWKDNIRMDARRIRCEGMDWVQLAEDREASEGFL
jgi:hypothetical protein